MSHGSLKDFLGQHLGFKLRHLKVEADPRSEREIIEAALAESRGRVSGPSGAAARLGIPPSTLDHRIKALKIDKTRFKFR
jgi:DNA-binding NtrC family response regulator